jgi:hypothetical protein
MYATEYDLEAEEYVPLPKGDVHKKKEIVQDVTLNDLDQVGRAVRLFVVVVVVVVVVVAVCEVLLFFVLCLVLLFCAFTCRQTRVRREDTTLCR